MYNLTKEDIKEIASQLLGCSSERVHVNIKLHYKEQGLAKRDGVIYCVLGMENYAEKLNIQEDGSFGISRAFNNQRIELGGGGIWVSDSMLFFCDGMMPMKRQFVYFECSRF